MSCFSFLHRSLIELSKSQLLLKAPLELLLGLLPRRLLGATFHKCACYLTPLQHLFAFIFCLPSGAIAIRSAFLLSA